MELSLVIPCYREGQHFRNSARQLLHVLDLTRIDYEVVFVDDCSPDDTRAQIEEVCALHPTCRYVYHTANRGRGAAFKTGYQVTSGEVTGFIDIDLEIPAHHVPELYRLLKAQDYDVVTGLRFYNLAQVKTMTRHILSHAYRVLCRAVLGLGVEDSETGCKFFRRSTASSAVLESESDGWFWDTEVMVRAALDNLRIYEMPVLFLRRTDKASTVRLIPDIFSYIVSLYQCRAGLGLGLANISPAYWTRYGYDAFMRALYGREYTQIYGSVAAQIPPGAEVLDVCCGSAHLYTAFLKDTHCKYLGLDYNGHFVMACRNAGTPARRYNLLQDDLPSADFVVICSSFYHFHSRELEIFEKLIRAARKKLIISEPVVNASTGGNRALAALARWMTRPGLGEHSFRYNRTTFETFARSNGAEIVSVQGRQALAVFPGLAETQEGRLPLGQGKHTRLPSNLANE